MQRIIVTAVVALAVLVPLARPAFADPAPGAVRITVERRTQANPNIGARVALNPQPLPPKGGDPWTQRGNALFMRGDFAGEATAFGHALDANASNAVALHNLGLAHARLGQVDQAKGELVRASQLARRQRDLGTAAASDRGIIIVSGRQQTDAVTPH